MARRRQPNVFGLAFLDAMTCGLGAVVLLYMVINAGVGLHAGRLSHDLQAEVDRLEREVLDGHRNLVELRNSLRRTDEERRAARGLSRRLIEQLTAIREELATYEASTLARREHLERLKSDLKNLEQESRRLAASIPDDETPGDRRRAFIGDGDRQYLTGLKVGGKRILILIDASASMLGDTIVNVIRRRNLPDEQKIRARKWQQAVATVDWLTTQLPRDARFQIYAFADDARPVLPDAAGTWLEAGDPEVLERAIGSLRRLVPGGGTSLHHAFAAAGTLRPAPDNLILLTDGLPTRGAAAPRRATVSGRERAKLFDRAVRQLERGVPVNVILLPMEGDPLAASAFWKLAVATRGAFLSPPEDWP